MHEMSIAMEVAAIAERTVGPERVGQVTAVALAVGEDSSLELSNLEFCLENPSDREIIWRSEFSAATPVAAVPSAEALVAALESSIHTCLKQAAEAVAEAAVKISGEQ